MWYLHIIIKKTIVKGKKNSNYNTGIHNESSNRQDDRNRFHSFA